MDDSRGYFKLGLFVLITAALLVGFVVALGANVFSRVESVPFETLFNESVAGLEPGAAVKYRGVTIGKVTQVTFADVKYPAALPQRSAQPQGILVEMALDPRKFTPVTVDQFSMLLAGMIQQGLRARLSRSLIGNLTVVEIDYVNPAHYPPLKIDWEPTSLYIPSAPSEMNEVFGGLERLVRELNEADISGLFHRIDKLVGDVDQGVSDLQLATLRERVLDMVDELRGACHDLDQLVAGSDVKHTVADLPVITDRLKSTLARIDRLMQDKRLDQILTGLATTMNHAGPAAADARRLLGELRELVASESDDIRVIVNNLRGVMENGRDITDDLKQNPSRLIFGSPPPKIDPREQR